jgi:hypothetical protein
MGNCLFLFLFTDTCFNQLRRCCLYSSDSLQRQHFIRFVYKCRKTEVQINYISSDKVRILSVSLPGLPALYITKPDTSLVTINTCIHTSSWQQVLPSLLWLFRSNRIQNMSLSKIVLRDFEKVWGFCRDGRTCCQEDVSSVPSYIYLFLLIKKIK